MGRLFTRIYLHFLGVLVAMALGAIVIGSMNIRGPMLHGFLQHVSLHAARLVAGRLSDPSRLAALITQLSSDFEVDLTVRDVHGKTLASAGRILPEPSASDLLRVAEGPVILSRFEPFCAASPVQDAESGQLVAVLEMSPRRHFGAFPIMRPVLGLAGVLLLVGLATAPLARRLSKPVDQLIEATDRFGQGDLAYRIAVKAPRARRRSGDQMLSLTVAWNQMAERIQDLVGGHRELLANVSHELRSPLARLRVALELLPREPSTEARLKDLEGDLGELERLIDDVLTASRLEAAGFPLHAEPIDAQGLLSQLAERARLDPSLAGKEVRVQGTVSLKADASLLKRALWNLLENAGKYGAPPVTLSAGSENGRAIFQVTDEGPGIASAEREKVLQPFVRGDKARTPGTGGFGLGLTLARRIAEAHGGSLTLGPALPDGRGCRVVISIPLT